MTQPPGIWETLTLLAGGGLRAAGASKKKRKEIFWNEKYTINDFNVRKLNKNYTVSKYKYVL